jgi:ribonucleoside-diphosphate reductase alpha chain
VTINEDEAGNPFEVFINVGRAGSDITADAEALGRLMSLALRIPSSYPPREVAKQIVHQLTGIGGASQRGFGPNRVHSLADAVSKVVSDYLKEKEISPVEEQLKVDSPKPNGNGHTSGNDYPNGHTEGNENGYVNGEAESLVVTMKSEKVEAAEGEPSQGLEIPSAAIEGPQPLTLGLQTRQLDLCPECGNASLVKEEGCKKCYSCGHSEC